MRWPRRSSAADGGRIHSDMRFDDLTYLDYNATTPIRTEVAEAMARAMSAVGNPSSVHRFGRIARRAVEDARDEVAALFDVKPAEIVFTGGGTEANDLALRGVKADAAQVSATEHDSVLRSVTGARRIPVDRNGIVDLSSLKQWLEEAKGRTITSVMLANNETGVVQPIAAVAAATRERGGLLHCDAIQGPGKTAVRDLAKHADLISVSAHKFGGPQGVGALIVREGAPVEAVLKGGGQERSRRAGTENTAGIVGFGKAAELARESGGEADRLRTLRDDLERRLSASGVEPVIVGGKVERLANTTCVALPGIPAEIQVMALDLAGVAVSAGSACSSGKVRRSQVLQAMRLSDDLSGSAVRISMGWATERSDIDRLVDAWTEMAKGFERRRIAPVDTASAA